MKHLVILDIRSHSILQKVKLLFLLDFYSGAKREKFMQTIEVRYSQNETIDFKLSGAKTTTLAFLGSFHNMDFVNNGAIRGEAPSFTFLASEIEILGLKKMLSIRVNINCKQAAIGGLKEDVCPMTRSSI